MSTVDRVIDMIDQLDLPEGEVNEIIVQLIGSLELRLLRDLPDEVEPTGLYKNVYRVEVLSDTDSVTDDLSELHRQITEGDSSGVVTHMAGNDITRSRMAAELISQGSDPAFLLGEDYDEDEED